MAHPCIAAARWLLGFSAIVAGVDEISVTSLQVLEKLGCRKVSRTPGVSATRS
jgi:RimJ/RimL family protein N-acetyltransferase